MTVHHNNAIELARQILTERNITLSTSAFDKLVTVFQHYIIGFISPAMLEQEINIIIGGETV